MSLKQNSVYYIILHHGVPVDVKSDYPSAEQVRKERSTAKAEAVILPVYTARAPTQMDFDFSDEEPTEPRMKLITFEGEF